MLSTFFGLETAMRGVRANQDALDVTSNNVDNANTPGYSREVANLATTNALQLPGDGPIATQVGTGVQVASITRDRNAFLDTKYRQQNATTGEWTVDQNTLNQVTAVMNEPSSTGLSTVMQNFWASWSQLGSNPGNLSAAQEVQQNAVTVASALNQMASQYSQLSGDLNTQLSTTMDQANSYMQGIAKLNGQISTAQNAGASPNNLLDQRDLLVDKLSNLVDVKTSTQNGQFTLTVGNNSSPAIGGSTVNQELVPQGGSTSSSFLTAIYPTSATTGQLKGIEDSIATVQQYSDNLNLFAQRLATGSTTVSLDGNWQFQPSGSTMPVSGTLPDGTTFDSTTSISSLTSHGVTVDNKTGLVEVPSGTKVTVDGLNGLMKLGYAQAGQGSGQPDFFTSGSAGTAMTAGNIQVGVTAGQVGFALRPQITTSNGSTSLSALSGDGTLAMTASDMKSASLSFQSASGNGMQMSGTLDQFLQAQVGQLGIQSQTANHEVTNQNSLLQQIDNQRQSVSGVDLNEEMTNMIKYQQGYNASAKVVATVNDMLNTLINGIGLS